MRHQAGVVDHHIDTAERFYRAVDEPLHLRPVGHVSGQSERFAALPHNLVDQRLKTINPPSTEHARAHVTEPRVTFEVDDAQAMSVVSASFDAALSGLVLNFIPKPMLAVQEMVRAVRPAGLVTAYVWDFASKMELMRYFWDAAVALDPAAVELDEGRRFQLCQPAALSALSSEGGLRDVQTRGIEVPTRFRDFDDYWSPFLGGQAPAPGYEMSLSEERRGALRERIRADLPVAADGSISLIARAWAVRSWKVKA